MSYQEADVFSVRGLTDGIYQVIENATGEAVFQGTIEEVNAWFSMRDKGFIL